MIVLFHLQFFVFVAGFSVLITQASALRCYKETKIAGNDWPGYENGEVDCPDGDDRCAILTYELDSIPMSLRFCLNSTECDDGCGLAEDIAEKQQLGTVSGCDETCCVGDLCNAPGKRERDGWKERWMDKILQK